MKTSIVGLIIFISTSSAAYSARATTGKIVQTKQGKIQGFVKQIQVLPNVPKVDVFRGIPFAAPPLGHLRFMPPVAVTPWKDVRNATQYEKVCPQTFPDVSNKTLALLSMTTGHYQEILKAKRLLKDGDEDCLYLNIYVPRKAEQKAEGGSSSSTTESTTQEKAGETKRPPLPVLLFIHGDSFEWGSGNLYDGSHLAVTGEMIVVTINYRLGIFGFFNPNRADEPGNPSNFALLDQIAALHWIRENVAYFGGDPSRVTIMGHGTGAVCANYLMTSEALPRGVLFQRAVLLSGFSYSPLATSLNSVELASAVGEYLNCPTEEDEKNKKSSSEFGKNSGENSAKSRENSAEKSNAEKKSVVRFSPQSLLSCLRDADTQKLRRAADARPYQGQFSVRWGPNFDGLVVHSYKNRARDYADKLSRYDLIFGLGTADAADFLNDRQLNYGVNAQERNQMLSNLVSTLYKAHQREIFSAIVTGYTDWSDGSIHPVRIRDGLVDALQDGLFTAPAVETGDYHSSLNPNSWFFVFDHQSRNPFYSQRLGSVHGEQLKFIFASLFDGGMSNKGRKSNVTEEEFNLSNAVIKYISNFVSYGTPNGLESAAPTESPEGIRIPKWEQYDPKAKKYLVLGGERLGARSLISMRDHYRADKVAMWLNLIPDLLAAAKDLSGSSENEDGSSKSSCINKENDETREKAGMATYQTYNELMPLLPHIKSLFGGPLGGSYNLPASSEVMWPYNLTRNANGEYHPKGFDNSTSVFADQMSPLDNYSTALGVTIAVGCSLLILNVLIFTAIYSSKEGEEDEQDDNCSFGTAATADNVMDSSSGVSHVAPATRSILSNRNNNNAASEVEELDEEDGDYMRGRYARPGGFGAATIDRCSFAGSSFVTDEPVNFNDGILQRRPANGGGRHQPHHLPPPEFADSNNGEGIRCIADRMK